MKYKGQICDGCKKIMDECEDIVVCPVCGTPQHRACWEERGECVNAHRHAEGFVWQEDKNLAQQSKRHEGKTVKCPICGKENPENALSCHDCGAPLTKDEKSSAPQANPINIFLNTMNSPANPFLYGVKEDPDERIGGEKVRDIASFVQNAAPKYITKFKKTEKDEKGKRKISFNWAAFFFAPLWFFYRKMWKVGLVFASMLLAISIAFTTPAMDFVDIYTSYAQELSDSQKAGKPTPELQKKEDAVVNASKRMAPMMGLNLLLALAAGFTGDTIYKKFTIKKLKLFREKATVDREFDALTLSKGGTSILFAFIGYFGYNMVYRLLLSLALLL